MNKKVKRGNKKIVTVLSIVLFVAIIICAVIYFVKEKPQNDTKKEMVEENVAEDMTFLEIETPYGMLYYPDKWEKELRFEAKEDSNVVISFYGNVQEKEIQLFDIIFNGKDGDLLGYLDDASVHILFYDLDIAKLDEESQNTIIGMSESASFLITELEKMDNYSNSGVPNIEGELKIETKYGTLYYPKKWESNLEFVVNEQDNYSVEFYTVIDGKEKQHLFDLVFGEYEEESVGNLTEDVNLYIHSYELEDEDKWSERDLTIYYGMQEDVNYIIDRLVEEGSMERIQ